jgi:hypothetical protein
MHYNNSFCIKAVFAETFHVEHSSYMNGLNSFYDQLSLFGKERAMI